MGQPIKLPYLIDVKSLREHFSFHFFPIIHYGNKYFDKPVEDERPL